MITEQISQTLQIAQEVAKEEPSRELSLAMTKLEEARFWADSAAGKAELTREQRRRAREGK